MDLYQFVYNNGACICKHEHNVRQYLQWLVFLRVNIAIFASRKQLEYFVILFALGIGVGLRNKFELNLMSFQAFGTIEIIKSTNKTVIILALHVVRYVKVIQ